jgi:hypothetical protein
MALKIKSVLSVYAPMVFLIFFASELLGKILFKFLLASMKTLTNSGDLKGRRIRISNSGGTQENWNPQISV